VTPGWALPPLWTLRGVGDKAGNRADSPARPRFQLNGCVPDSPTTYRLAPALGLRLVGRILVTLAVLVGLPPPTTGGAVRTLGATAAVALLGLAAAQPALTHETHQRVRTGIQTDGFAIRFLGGVGVPAATWSQVDEVVAASPGGQPCLVLRLEDGRMTRLPMAAVAGDPDVLALDVRRRVRDAHTPDEASEH